MVTLFILSLVGCWIFFAATKAGKAGDARQKLLRSGVDARGIVLSADRTPSTTATIQGVRYEKRSMVLDVEVPGRAPYEVSVSPLVPRVCDPLPGSVLDLRVDLARPNDVAILGPAGSLGWMNAMPALFPRVGPAAAGGCARPVFALAFVPFIVLFGILGFFTGGSHSAESGSHASGAKHDSCEAAARCCAKIGSPGGCKQFKTMSESACKAVLDVEKKTAARAKKVCE